MPINIREGYEVRPGQSFQTRFPTADLNAPAPVSVGQQLGAALQIDNFTLNAAQRIEESLGYTPPDKAEFDLSQKLTMEEKESGSFNDALSQKELVTRRERIAREKKARRDLEAGPLPAFLASMFAIAVDPVNYVPILGTYKAGGSISRIALRAGATAAAENVAVEMGLYALQEDRRLSEALFAGIFGGVIGAGAGTIAGALGRSKMDRAVKEAVEFTERELGYPGSVGSQRTGEGPSGPADTELVGAGFIRPVVERLSKLHVISPALERASSRFHAASTAANEFFSHGMMTRGEKAGKSFSLETPVDTEISFLRDRTNHDFYKRFNQARIELKEAGVKIEGKELAQRLATAMRRGDVDIKGDPLITKLAKDLRRDIFDPFKDDMIALGFFKEGKLKGATSWFPRVVDLEKIKGEAGERFKNKIAQWLSDTEKGEKLDFQYYVAAAEDIIEQQKKTALGRIPNLQLTQRGSLKGREWDIPDELIEEFLDNDAVRVLGRYINTVSADGTLQRRFGSVQEPEFHLKVLAEEVSQARVQAEKRYAKDRGKLDKALRKIGEQAERQEALIKGSWNHMRGTAGVTEGRPYGVGRNALATLRTFNFMKSLGGVMLSSIPDTFRVTMTEGLARSIGPVLLDMATGFKNIRLAKHDLQAIGNALDVWNNQRSASLLDAIDPYTFDVGISKRLGQASNVFSKATGLPHWNVLMKSIAGSVVENRIAQVSRAAVAGKKVSARDMTRMAQSRLSKEDMKVIAAQVEKHGHERNGAWNLGMQDWDEEAFAVRLAVEDALNRDVDNAIITPGTGDAPLWVNSEVGKTIFQFKRFGSSATQRILIGGLQAGLGQRDISAFAGMAMMAAAGAGATALKDIARDGEVKKRATRAWVKEGIDRSGLMGLYFDLENIAGGFTGGLVPSSLLAEQPTSRFAERNFLGRVLGPTAGLVQETAEAGSATVRHGLDGGLTQSDFHRYRRLTPFANLFYVQYLGKMMEEGLAESLGLPKRSK